MPRIRKKATEKARDRYLKNTYGITLDRYKELFALQKGKCALCHQKSNRNLCVDHVHFPVGTKAPSKNCTADRVRGLLCHNCNKYVMGAIERRKAVNPRKLIEALVQYANKYSLRGEI